MMRTILIDPKLHGEPTMHQLAATGRDVIHMRSPYVPIDDDFERVDADEAIIIGSPLCADEAVQRYVDHFRQRQLIVIWEERDIVTSWLKKMARESHTVTELFGATETAAALYGDAEAPDAEHLRGDQHGLSIESGGLPYRNRAEQIG